MTLAGALGLTKQLPLERYLRDAQVLSSFMVRIYLTLRDYQYPSELFPYHLGCERPPPFVHRGIQSFRGRQRVARLR